MPLPPAAALSSRDRDAFVKEGNCARGRNARTLASASTPETSCEAYSHQTTEMHLDQSPPTAVGQPEMRSEAPRIGSM